MIELFSSIFFPSLDNMAIIGGSLMSDVIAGILVFLAAVYIYLRYFLYNYWKKLGVPCVEPTVVPVGNLGPIIGGKVCLGQLCADGYNEYKKNRYFGMYAFHRPYLVVTDPELIKHVLTKEFDSFHGRGDYCNEKVDPLTGQLTLVSGTKWRNLRSKLSPTFTAGKVRGMFGILAKLGEKFARCLKEKADRRELIELKDLSDRHGTDVTMTTAFGIKCDSLEDPDDRRFLYWGKKLLNVKPAWTMISMFGGAIMHFFSIPYNDPGVTKFFTDLFRDTLEYRERNNVKIPDFMNSLMQLMKRGYVDADEEDDERATKDESIADAPDGRLTFLEGVAQTVVFFVAGFETTAALVTHCLYELAHNQDIQEKLRSDIDAALEKFGGVTYESIREMRYLDKVVSEALRKYPSVPILKRVCNRNVRLPTMDFSIDKGIEVIVPLVSLHMDPDIYPDPEKFDPERFSKENTGTRHPYAYLPFGEGPRMCIGMRFADAQSKVTLVSVLSRYRVKMAPSSAPIPLEFDPNSFVLSARGKLRVAIEPR